MMKVSLERQGKNVVQLGVELESDKALKAYEVACRQLSHKVNIPGFRKGKAPRNVLEKTLGVEYIKKEALEKLVPELLNRAIVDENLDLITQPEIDSCDFELGLPLKLSAKFEVRPEVTLGQYQATVVNVPLAQLPEDALERALKNVADSKATLSEVANRPIAMGDTVVLNFECFVDEKLVEGGKAEGLLLEMKEGNFIEGFCEQIIGKEPGSNCEVKVRFPDNYRNKELSGQDAVFKVALKGIRAKVVPDINDELAKSVGQDSLAALKELLEAKLNEEVKQENESRAQKAVVEAVVANAQVDIPETMVEREAGLLMGQLKAMVERNNQRWEDFEKAPEFVRIKEAKTQEAQQRVLTSLVLGAIVRSEKINVTDEEMMPYLAEVAARYEVPIERVIDEEQVWRQVMEEVLTHKVVQYLVSSSQITYVPDDGELTGTEKSAES